MKEKTSFINEFGILKRLKSWYANNWWNVPWLVHAEWGGSQYLQCILNYEAGTLQGCNIMATNQILVDRRSNFEHFWKFEFVNIGQLESLNTDKSINDVGMSKRDICPCRVEVGLELQGGSFFFWNDRQNTGRIALKSCIAYGAFFEQLFAKNDRVRSAHRAMTSLEVQPSINLSTKPCFRQLKSLPLSGMETLRLIKTRRRPHSTFDIAIWPFGGHPGWLTLDDPKLIVLRSDWDEVLVLRME